MVPLIVPNVNGNGAVNVRKSPTSRNRHSSRFPFTDHRPRCFGDHSFFAHDTPPAASKKNTPFQSPIETVHFPVSSLVSEAFPENAAALVLRGRSFPSGRPVPTESLCLR